ncbi:MAG: DNA translocase FtsK 4TM domain-containing protein [Eubacteriales bacterium]|nr:DNA translocase FtsK 4TM domain-containing protein [Eubacteriales bacterium]
MAKTQNGQKKKQTASATSAARLTQLSEPKPMHPLLKEALILLFVAAMIFLMFSVLGFGGLIGGLLRQLLFGLLGLVAYVLPPALTFFVFFLMANQGQMVAKIKVAAMAVVLVSLQAVLHLILYSRDQGRSIFYYYGECARTGNGGGLIGAALSTLSRSLIGTVGSYVLFTVLMIIGIIFITERSLLKSLRKGSSKAAEKMAEKSAAIHEQRALRREELRRQRLLQREYEQEQETNQEQEQEKSASADVLGRPLKEVVANERVVPKHWKDALDASDEPDQSAKEQPIPIVVIEEDEEERVPVRPTIHLPSDRQTDQDTALREREHEVQQEALVVDERPVVQELYPEESQEDDLLKHPLRTKKTTEQQETAPVAKAAEEVIVPADTAKFQYRFPPLSLLKRGVPTSAAQTKKQLQETAEKLQQTLDTFGVKATISDVCYGPSVTRYEIQPEMGVKVSKILGLADDIKLNLAAADIRIEAPIPGKAAIGIEVPNKENQVIMLRDVLEAQEFQEHSSQIAFAVGKDIGGNTVVADIAKMPHLLIAGATGSGKSVCINGIILSLLYKADPNDVKLIMVDPKVVELSVYNQIPHLLIPVVTDPKKAAGALHWAVVEMDKRYQQFAHYNVRDLAGYNAKVASIADIEAEQKPQKMPQLVIIVDELADLMMAAPGDVEDSIVRLAQKARAAGIHLIIATQRPSVNVITGLIKANMPSRIAFSVTSGVDSRTILDMNGAEKLLGKGDMLYYPQNFQKPARIQGAFVSDREVNDIVKFVIEQNSGQAMPVEESLIRQMDQVVTGEGGLNPGVSDQDDYFVDAAKFVIDKDKASIGMLQRAFKVGFNRAARIMEQLAEAGVVSEEDGTKPRKVLMNREEFENYLEQQ